MISRNVGEHRRTREIEDLRQLRIFKSAPSLGQLKDGERVLLKGSSKMYWRNGDKLYELDGTEV